MVQFYYNYLAVGRYWHHEHLNYDANQEMATTQAPKVSNCDDDSIPNEKVHHEYDRPAQEDDYLEQVA